jgi:hypothetical protein
MIVLLAARGRLAIMCPEHAMIRSCVNFPALSAGKLTQERIMSAAGGSARARRPVRGIAGPPAVVVRHAAARPRTPGCPDPGPRLPGPGPRLPGPGRPPDPGPRTPDPRIPGRPAQRARCRVASGAVAPRADVAAGRIWPVPSTMSLGLPRGRQAVMSWNARAVRLYVVGRRADPGGVVVAADGLRAAPPSPFTRGRPG